ncbi:porin [Haemophilus parahaemolyticus]|uniref:porin n=1 Tax=Haemophilus parahaemolyticus TaxID=735 RepID=UPI0036F25322
MEWRFQNLASSQHGFDHLYDHQRYAGFGHKSFGELTYGNMATITDEMKQTDLANTLSLSDGLLLYAARHAIQYTYSGVEGLKVGAFYSGHSQRGANGLDLSVYTMYAYKENKLNTVSGQNDTKRRNNQFMVGSEYYLFSDYLKPMNLKLKAFVE